MLLGCPRHPMTLLSPAVAGYLRRFVDATVRRADRFFGEMQRAIRLRVQRGSKWPQTASVGTARRSGEYDRGHLRTTGAVFAVLALEGAQFRFRQGRRPRLFHTAIAVVRGLGDGLRHRRISCRCSPFSCGAAYPTRRGRRVALCMGLWCEESDAPWLRRVPVKSPLVLREGACEVRSFTHASRGPPGVEAGKVTNGGPTLHHCWRSVVPLKTVSTIFLKNAEMRLQKANIWCTTAVVRGEELFSKSMERADFLVSHSTTASHFFRTSGRKKRRCRRPSAVLSVCSLRRQAPRFLWKARQTGACASRCAHGHRNERLLGDTRG